MIAFARFTEIVPSEVETEEERLFTAIPLEDEPVSSEYFVPDAQDVAVRDTEPDQGVSPSLEPAVAPVAPERPAEAPEPAFALTDPTLGDVDRLWDWIREDGPERFAAFEASTSVELHRKMTALHEQAQQGRAAFHSLYWQEAHVGFGILCPIFGTQAQIHIYLAPSMRGRGLPLVRRAVVATRHRYPTLDLVAITSDSRIAHFAQRVGLTETQYVLTAAKGESHVNQ